MKISRIVVVVITFMLFGCSGAETNRQISVEEFIQYANQNGFYFKKWDSGYPKPNLTYYWVSPGNMLIWFEVVEDAKAAKKKMDLYNEDLRSVKKVVAKDNTAASEMGENPEAFSTGNLMMFVPLNYVVHYDEAKVLIGLFKKF
jgi:hypothetical protein